MIVLAMSRAVMDLSLSGHPLTQESIIEKLEQYLRETGNVNGKCITRDAVEIVRKDSNPLN